jgi:hypothetical protein
MKVTPLLPILLLFSISAPAGRQDDAGLSRVTLYSVQGHGNDWSRSSVDFDSGIRGFTGEGAHDFDLTYGSITMNTDLDWFEVRDPRSMIIDLGEKGWRDFRETPSFTKRDKPRKPPRLLTPSTPKVADVSAGSKEVSPYQQFRQVVAGHMYLMKVTRKRKTIYVMFRVDNLAPRDTCLLSWKKVPPPAEDEEK